MATRIVAGLAMVAGVLGVVRAGHGWVVLCLSAIQLQLFRELLNVRYSEYKAKQLQTEAPLFRTIQWLWFAVWQLHCYGKAAVATAVGWQEAVRWLRMGTFCLFCVALVVTVLSFNKGVIRYQFSQLSWTLMAVALACWQLHLALYTLAEGLFWFILPCALVACNDTAAYFCGVAFGGKLLTDKQGKPRPFLPFLSPNKTWEGFLGAFLLTCLCGFCVLPQLFNYDWLTCSVAQLQQPPCHPPAIFFPQAYHPFSWLALGQWAPLPQLQLTLMPVQLHCLSLAVFASSVAPCGGFLASAVKRAYGIKDFDSIIPGHGGLVDRLDCQLVMCVATYVYYQTCVQPHITQSNPVELPHIMAAIDGLQPHMKVELYQWLGQALQQQ